MALSGILPSPSVPYGPADMSGPPAPGDAGVFAEARKLLSQKLGTGGSWTGQLIIQAATRPTDPRAWRGGRQS